MSWGANANQIALRLSRASDLERDRGMILGWAPRANHGPASSHMVVYSKDQDNQLDRFCFRRSWLGCAAIVAIVALVSACGRTKSTGLPPGGKDAGLRDSRPPQDAGPRDATADMDGAGPRDGGRDAQPPQDASIDASVDAGLPMDASVDLGVAMDASIDGAVADASIDASIDSAVPPPDIDFVVNSFTRDIVDDEVTYHVEVCNAGVDPAPATEIDLYFDQGGSAPADGVRGDATAAVPALASGGCSLHDIVWSNALVGTYQSWTRVDPANLIAETDDTNNDAGPLGVTIDALDCDTLCDFGVSCGYFAAAKKWRCEGWCNVLETSEQACQTDALRAVDCTAYENCAQLPPPAPPDGFCGDLCAFLIDPPCEIREEEEREICEITCEYLPEDNVTCASDAIDDGDCLAALFCFFI